MGFLGDVRNNKELDNYFSNFKDTEIELETKQQKTIDIYNGHVSIGNRLLKASFDLNVNERKLLHYCLSQFNSAKELLENPEFVITASEYAELLEIPYNTAYIALVRTSQKILTNHIAIKGLISPNSETKLPWFKRFTKDPASSTIRVVFNDYIFPYIANLGKLESFTRLVNRESLTLAGKYSARLYELLSIERWRGHEGTLEITLDELYYRWQVPESAQEFSKFKQKILTKAISELKEKDILTIEVKVPKFGAKQGKKIVKVQLDYKFHHNLSDYGLICKSKSGIKESSTTGDSYEQLPRTLTQERVRK